VSRRAAEVAIAIAGACKRPITALYVSTPSGSDRRKRGGFRTRRQEQAIMKEIVEIADRYDVAASTEIRADLAPRDAILAEAKKRGHELIVMGVSRRSGDKLFFGDTAAAVLEKSPGSIIFIAS
jgi:nucleotide-binding universal stress UspA family protein